jgi:hypothetical protein
MGKNNHVDIYPRLVQWLDGHRQGAARPAAAAG